MADDADDGVSSSSTATRLRGGGGKPSPWSDLLEVSYPPNSYDGVMYMDALDLDGRSWSYVVMFVPVRGDNVTLTSKLTTVRIQRTWIYVSVTDPSTGNTRVLLDRQLHQPIVPDDSYWDIEKNPFDNDVKGIRLVLAKQHNLWLWLAGFKEEELQRYGRDGNGPAPDRSFANKNKRSAKYIPYT
eukprot:CAMPEP_0170185702 /NCGR_PEP_ID=MMETSP0040_2-20121228/37255_1 /TAXON_ID=641309 /ORGANISM="Lotharella oceanica, Strain CCMP622" /LENGTH=184 /DNA_ID=CAMNT_0010432191 /DNA_START=82 /DNA_END=636 /DNA_ORIENTATION=+